MLFDESGWHCPACDFIPPEENGLPVFAPELSQHNDTFSAEFFAELAQLEQGHFWFEARNRLLLWSVQQHFPHAKSVLEIGCGTGFVLQQFQTHLNGVVLCGSDLLVEGLRFARQRLPSAELLQMDARYIPYKDHFDVIGAFDVIEHIHEDNIVLSQMFNAVKPGGGIIISVPQHQFLWSAMDDLSFHKRRYDRNDLVSKVEQAGFSVVRTTSFVSFLLPLMLLSRTRMSQKAVESDTYAEFKINPIVNALLYQTLAIEIALIRRGISFRYGGSRLLIAQRPDIL